jgi:hypothetical protein
MRQKRIILLSFLILISCFQLRGQEIQTEPNSLTVINVVNDFYEWYIYSTRKEKNEENRPIFIIDDQNETIRLDFSKYLQNLKRLNFSEALINREILDYRECEQNLEKITIEEFASFDDILDFEDIGCGFDNSYKWIGGQEMCSGIRINKVEFIDPRNCRIEIEYYSINGDQKSFWGNSKIIMLQKINDDWKINDIK